MSDIWKRWCRLCAGEENVEIPNEYGEFRDLFSYIDKCLPPKVDRNEYPKLLCDMCSNNLFEFNAFARKCEKVQLLFNIFNDTPPQSAEYYADLRDKYLLKKESDGVIKIINSVKVEINDVNEEKVKIKEERVNNDDEWGDSQVGQFEQHYYEDDAFNQDDDDDDDKKDIVETKSKRSESKKRQSSTTRKPRKKEKDKDKDKNKAKEKIKDKDKPKTKKEDKDNAEESTEKVKKKRIYTKKVPYDISKDEKTCPYCNETFHFHNALIKHMSFHFPNFICDICARVFDTRFRLTKHISTHHAKLLKCEICGKMLKGELGLKKHMKFIHTAPETKLTYTCQFCPARFRAYTSRAKHLVECHDVKPREFKCAQCNKIFTQNCGLTRHIKRIHKQDKPVPCPICDFRFFSKSDMLDHIKRHSSEKKFKCQTCTKAFKGRFSLNEHMKIHRNESFVCSYCGKSFLYKYSLKTHLRLTHEKPPPEPPQ